MGHRPAVRHSRTAERRRVQRNVRTAPRRRTQIAQIRVAGRRTRHNHHIRPGRPPIGCRNRHRDRIGADEQRNRTEPRTRNGSCTVDVDRCIGRTGRRCDNQGMNTVGHRNGVNRRALHKRRRERSIADPQTREIHAVIQGTALVGADITSCPYRPLQPALVGGRTPHIAPAVNRRRAFGQSHGPGRATIVLQIFQVERANPVACADSRRTDKIAAGIA